MDRTSRDVQPPRGPRQDDRKRKLRNGRLSSQLDTQALMTNIESRSPHKGQEDRRQDKRTKYDGPRGRQPGDRDMYEQSCGRAPYHKAGNEDRRRRGSNSSQEYDQMRSHARTSGGQRQQQPRSTQQAAYDKPIDWDDPSDAMKQIMGFDSFRTTKETKVPGNEFNYAVSKAKVSQYRQYMNRVGGFNRPLSPSRGKRLAKPAETDIES